MIKLVLVGSFLIPLLGCILAALNDNSLWFILLAPLIIYMEGGIAISIAAIIITSFFMNG